MPDAHDALDTAIAEFRTARQRTGNPKSKQVTANEERDYLSSVAYSWLRSHRRSVELHPAQPDLASVDRPCREILRASGKSAARTTFRRLFQEAIDAMVELRATLPVAPLVPHPGEGAPDFSPLVSSAAMRGILERRWQECSRCVTSGAHLAAVVMMGGLLEAMFVARSNRLADKSPLISASSAPKDKATGKTLELTKWTLDPYISVGNELGWITDAGKQLASVVREYRNYVHPEKELRDGIVLGANDSAMFWSVTRLLIRQLVGVA